MGALPVGDGSVFVLESFTGCIPSGRRNAATFSDASPDASPLSSSSEFESASSNGCSVSLNREGELLPCAVETVPVTGRPCAVPLGLPGALPPTAFGELSLRNMPPMREPHPVAKNVESPFVFKVRYRSLT